MAIKSNVSTMESPVSSGFNLQRVGMSKFNSYNEPAVVDFKSKFSTIYGKTGSGKTTILDAMTFALYKNTSRMESGLVYSDVVRPGGFAFVEFEKNGHAYYVKRGKRSDDSSYVILSVDGKQFKGKITTIDNEIERIIDMDYKSFVSSSIVRQEEMTMFSKETPSQRVKLLQRLFHLQVYQDALKNAKEDKKVLEKRLDSLKAETDGMKVLIDNEEEIKNGIKQNILSIKSTGRERDEYLERLDVLRSDLESLRFEKEQLAALFEKRNALCSAIEDLRSTRDSLEESVSNEEKLIGSLRESLPDGGTISIKRKTVEKLDELRRKRDRLENEMQTIESMARDQDKKYKELKNKYSGGITLEDYTGNAIRVGEAKALDEENADELQANLYQQKPDVVKGVVSSVLDREITSAGSGIEKIMDEKGAVDSKIASIKGEIGDITMQDYVTMVERMNGLKREIEGKEESLDSKRTEIVKVVSAIEEKKKTLESVEENIGNKGSILENFSNKEAELNRIEIVISNIDRSIGEAKGNMNALKKQLDKLNEYKGLIKNNLEKIIEIRDELDTVNVVINEILHESGVTMYAIDLVISVIAIRASELLNYMSGGELSLVKFVSFKKGNRYGFEIYVDDKKAVFFSGGETTWINASIRFAIAEKLSEISRIGSKMKTLFIDEGNIGSLDKVTAVPRFLETISNLESHFDKIILISHVEGLPPDTCNKVITVEKFMGYSRITS